MNKLKIAYFGSPDFSATILENLIRKSDELGISVEAVFTQPDRPVGRKGVLTPTPVKQMAEKYKIQIVDDPTVLASFDLAILYAYAQIIGEAMLKAPRYGFWNIHPSLLPKYRGASPTAFPLMMGEGETGVSLMQMDSLLDHGPLLGQKSYQVSPTDSRKILEKKLTDLSFELLRENLAIINDNLKPVEQDHSLATFTRKLTKNDGYISIEFIRKALQNAPIIPEEFPTALKDYINKNKVPLPQEKRPAGEILYNYWRAMYDWPGIWSKIIINGVEKRLKITEMSYYPTSPAEVHDKSITKVGLFFDKVQLEGKNEVDFSTFTSAYKFL
jgi:methionyl-tRNA formyltransferase